MSPKKKQVVLGVTGSIAAYKAADIIRRLREKGARVSVIMTEKAKHFITPLTLSALSGEKVHCEMFSGQEASWEIGHIELAKEAGVFLIAPATANIIGKLAAGIADDLLTCMALATKAQILIVPAMNENMWNNKIVQENSRKLKKAGMLFVDPVKGGLACGVVGKGHIADVDVIVGKTLALMSK